MHNAKMAAVLRAGVLCALLQATTVVAQPLAVEDPVTPALPGITAGGLVIEWLDPAGTEVVDVNSTQTTVLDEAGHSWVAAETGIEVFGAKGEALGVIPLPVKPQGLAFAGPGKHWLYVFGDDAVYRFQTLTTGVKQAQ